MKLCSDFCTCAPCRSTLKNCYSPHRGEFSPKSSTRFFLFSVILYLLQCTVFDVFHSCVSNSYPQFVSFSNLEKRPTIFYLCIMYIFVCNNSDSIQVRPYLIPDSNDLIRQVEKPHFATLKTFPPQRQRQELNESRPHTCSCTQATTR